MLLVNALHITFKRYSHVIWQRNLATIHDLSLTVHRGEMVAVVGASGAGKSLLAHAILGILPPNACLEGEMLFKGRALTDARKQHLRGRKITLIPQSVGFLNPLARIGAQLTRAAKLAGISPAARSDTIEKTLQRYGLSRQVADLYPFQLSGGMARRVLIAMATVPLADLIVADEPTVGLDPKAASESLGWLRHLADQGKGILLITHDIATALEVVDTVVVFHAGTTVEIAAASDFKAPSDHLRHPYTRALWQAVPCNGFNLEATPEPTAANGSNGCHFVGHCNRAVDQCLSMQPVLVPQNGGMVRCLPGNTVSLLPEIIPN